MALNYAKLGPRHLTSTARMECLKIRTSSGVPIIKSKDIEGASVETLDCHEEPRMDDHLALPNLQR